MKKFLFMFLIVASIASAATFAFAGDDEGDGEKKFVIHGEVRQRADFEDNLRDFTDETDDSFIFFPYRARVAAEGHFMKDVVGYVEFQAFGVWGEGHPPQSGSDLPFDGDNESGDTRFITGRSAFQQESLNDANVTLYQAFIGLNDIGETNFSMKFGRQEIVRGTEMLLGDLDFYNGLVHDAAMGSWDWDGFSLDVWASRPSQEAGAAPFSGVFDTGTTNPDHQSINFYGAWAQWGEWDNGADAAAYVLYYEDGRGIGDTARRAFYTIGGRTGRELHGDEDGFTWNAELAVQTGDQDDGTGSGDNKSISASAFEGELGYGWHTGSASQDHKVYVSVAAATGDDDSTDDDAKAFDPLYQDFHGRYGQADLFRFSDIQVISVGYNVTMNDHSFGADIYDFTTAEDFTLSTGDTETDLASEVDLWWKFQYSHNTQITVATAFVKTGKIIEDEVDDLTGFSADDGLRLIANLRLRF